MTNKTCIVCGSANYVDLYLTHDRMFDIPRKYRVKKCRKCLLLFIDPQPTAAVLSQHYPSKKYYSYSASQKKNIFGVLRSYLIKNYYKPNFIASIFAKLVKNVPAMPSYKKNGKILDVGCGAGDMLILLRDLGWETYGIEIDKNAVKTARERGLSRVKLGTYKDIFRFPDNYFDSIRLYHVIEHLDDPMTCLKLIYKKLKKDGELILGTPNYSSLTSKIFGKYWYNLDIPRHMFVFSPRNLQELVAKSGFKIGKIEFCSAGGIMKSMQYAIDALNFAKIQIQNKLWIFFFFYPIEWFLDKIRIGDIFILKASKGKSRQNFNKLNDSLV